MVARARSAHHPHNHHHHRPTNASLTLDPQGPIFCMGRAGKGRVCKMGERSERVRKSRGGVPPHTQPHSPSPPHSDSTHRPPAPPAGPPFDPSTPQAWWRWTRWAGGCRARLPRPTRKPGPPRPRCWRPRGRPGRPGRRAGRQTGALVCEGCGGRARCERREKRGGAAAGPGRETKRKSGGVSALWRGRDGATAPPTLFRHRGGGGPLRRTPPPHPTEALAAGGQVLCGSSREARWAEGPRPSTDRFVWGGGGGGGGGETTDDAVRGRECLPRAAHQLSTSLPLFLPSRCVRARAHTMCGRPAPSQKPASRAAQPTARAAQGQAPARARQMGARPPLRRVREKSFTLQNSCRRPAGRPTPGACTASSPARGLTKPLKYALRGVREPAARPSGRRPPWRNALSLAQGWGEEARAPRKNSRPAPLSSPRPQPLPHTPRHHDEIRRPRVCQ